MPMLADLRDIVAADVYIGDELVATLTRDGHDEVVFRYLDTVPHVGRRGSVAWSLPRSGGFVMTASGSVPPFFAGLLPEGIRLGVVVDAAKTSIDDHFTLLLAVGDDTIGDIRVVPAGTTPRDLAPMVNTADIPDLTEVFRRLAGTFDADPVAIPGVQPKVSAAMWSIPARTSSGPAILKLTPPTGFPRLVENEHFFLRMADACGLRTPEIRLIHDAAGRSGLLVLRFDRLAGRRIPQEDACQVTGLYPASKYRLKTEDAISALAIACERGGGSRAAATLELFRVVVFSWLIGNGDLHGKNLSIHAPDGLWRPTPAYDLVTTQPYTGWRDPMAMTLYGRANRLTRDHLIESAMRLGIRRRAVERMIDDVLTLATPWIDRCDEIGFTERQTELLTDLMQARAASLR